MDLPQLSLGGIPSLSIVQTQLRLEEISESLELLQIFGHSDVEHVQAFKQLSANFRDAAAFASQIQEIQAARGNFQSGDDDHYGSGKDPIEKLVVHILEKISLLDVGEFCILPGGIWKIVIIGH